MRVLIVGPISSPIIRRLRFSLVKMGIEVYVASYNTLDSEYVINLGKVRSFFDYLNFKKINKIIKEINPDLIHANIVNHYGLMCAFNRKPMLLALWGSEILVDPYVGGFFRKSFFRIINAFVLWRCNLCHTSAQHVLDKAASQYNRIKEKSEVFYWGLPLLTPSEHQYIQSELNLEQEFDLVKSDYLVFPRGLSKIYNPDFVVRVIERLNTHPAFYGKIVVLKGFASDAEFNLFKDKIKDLNVILIDRLLNDDELFVLYSRSKFHFSFPLSDALGGGVIEPSLLGSYPILSALPSYRIYAEKHDAYIVDDESDESIKKLMNFLILFSSDLKNNFLLNSFSDKAVIKKIINCYLRVLENNEN